MLLTMQLVHRLGLLWHPGDWHLESAWPIRHGPSQIPTDLDLPHKAFGSQVVDDSPFERPEILPFSIYAACRILDTTPDDEVRPYEHAEQHASNTVVQNIRTFDVFSDVTCTSCSVIQLGIFKCCQQAVLCTSICLWLIFDTSLQPAQTNGDIYEALRTIAACYVRADMSGICDCITAYKLTDVLSKATRLKRMQQALVDGCHGDSPPDQQGMSFTTVLYNPHGVWCQTLVPMFCNSSVCLVMLH